MKLREFLTHKKLTSHIETNTALQKKINQFLDEFKDDKILDFSGPDVFRKDQEELFTVEEDINAYLDNLKSKSKLSENHVLIMEGGLADSIQGKKKKKKKKTKKVENIKSFDEFTAEVPSKIINSLNPNETSKNIKKELNENYPNATRKKSLKKAIRKISDQLAGAQTKIAELKRTISSAVTATATATAVRESHHPILAFVKNALISDKKSIQLTDESFGHALDLTIEKIKKGKRQDIQDWIDEQTTKNSSAEETYKLALNKSIESFNFHLLQTLARLNPQNFNMVKLQAALATKNYLDISQNNSLLNHYIKDMFESLITESKSDSYRTPRTPREKIDGFKVHSIVPKEIYYLFRLHLANSVDDVLTLLNEADEDTNYPKEREKEIKKILLKSCCDKLIIQIAQSTIEREAIKEIIKKTTEHRSQYHADQRFVSIGASSILKLYRSETANKTISLLSEIDENGYFGENVKGEEKVLREIKKILLKAYCDKLVVQIKANPKTFEIHYHSNTKNPISIIMFLKRWSNLIASLKQPELSQLSIIIQKSEQLLLEERILFPKTITEDIKSSLKSHYLTELFQAIGIKFDNLKNTTEENIFWINAASLSRILDELTSSTLKSSDTDLRPYKNILRSLIKTRLSEMFPSIEKLIQILVSTPYSSKFQDNAASVCELLDQMYRDTLTFPDSDLQDRIKMYKNILRSLINTRLSEMFPSIEKLIQILVSTPYSSKFQDNAASVCELLDQMYRDTLIFPDSDLQDRIEIYRNTIDALSSLKQAFQPSVSPTCVTTSMFSAQEKRISLKDIRKHMASATMKSTAEFCMSAIKSSAELHINNSPSSTGIIESALQKLFGHDDPFVKMMVSWKESCIHKITQNDGIYSARRTDKKSDRYVPPHSRLSTSPKSIFRSKKKSGRTTSTTNFTENISTFPTEKFWSREKPRISFPQ